MQKYGFQPVIASDGDALTLLKKEFPDLTFYELPAYNISYSKKKSQKSKLLLQSPAILKAALEEKKTVKKIHTIENLSGIISDNRFGIRHSEVPSVYITHQINVLSGVTTLVSSKIHKQLIKKFDACWVPDIDVPDNLSGMLSHTRTDGFNIRFIGSLSRLESEKKNKKYDILILLSGPEPQRSLLENRLLKQLVTIEKNILFVRGCFNCKTLNINSPFIELKNYLLAHDLQDAINQSEVIVARSGYSTIMDLAKLHKQAFFIPTPGQYEQEYLAQRMKDLTIAPFANQEDFRVEMLGEVENYKGFSQQYDLPLEDSLFQFFEGK